MSLSTKSEARGKRQEYFATFGIKGAIVDRSRPNFILFITDQHRADFLGCYGHPIVRTPHIDSIAARGTAFDRFYVASPVCMPNRSSLMTGRMPEIDLAGLTLSR